MGLLQVNNDRQESRPHKTGLAKVAVEFSADTFVVKTTTLAKHQNVSSHFETQHKLTKKNKKYAKKKIYKAYHNWTAIIVFNTNTFGKLRKRK